MQSDLLEFLVTKLDEESSFSKVRSVAEEAIKRSMDKTSEEKEKWVFAALTELCSIKETTIKMKKIILEAIEVVMLSRRVSDVKSKSIFSSQINGNSNHTWLINGAKLLISSLYPSLNVEYITTGQENEEKLLNIIEQLQSTGSIWVVVGYSRNYHLSLLRLELDGDNLKVQVLDSLGAIPNRNSSSQSDKYDRGLAYLIGSLVDKLTIDNYSITTSADRRQKDGVNCFSFILNDLEVSENYLLEGQSYFFDSKDTPKTLELVNVYILPFLEKFYDISQFQENSTKKFTMPLNAEQPKLGNSIAINKSIGSVSKLVENSLLTFKPEHYQEEGESDVDEEINECVIM